MISKKLFTGDGTTNRFLSEFIIKSIQFARPYCYIYDNTLNPNGSEDVLQDTGSVWSYPDNLYRRGEDLAQSADLVTVDKWNVVDNSILFYTSPLSGTKVWVEVATTPEEFGETLTAPAIARVEEVATAVKASETAAAASASSASTSATNSANSATAAASSASDSSNYATDSANSAASSISSASIATTQADIATSNATISTNQATASAASASISTTQAGIATTKAGEALASEQAAAASFDSFDDRYLGAKSSAPSVDNDGNALLVGALYFDSTENFMYVRGTSGWVAAYATVDDTGALVATNNLSDLNNLSVAQVNLEIDNVDNTSDLNKPLSTVAKAAVVSTLNSTHAAYGYTKYESVDDRFLETDTPNVLVDKVGDEVRFSDGLYERLGAELITGDNSTFDSSIGDWLPRGATSLNASSSKLSIGGVSDGGGYLNVAVQNGVSYIVSLNLESAGANAIKVRLGNSGQGSSQYLDTAYTSNDSMVTFEFSSTSTSLYITTISQTTDSAYIDNISVKELPQATLPVAPFTTSNATNTDELLDDSVNGLTTQYAHNKGDIVVAGSELVTNGTFDTDTDWVHVDSAISGGQLTTTSTANSFSYGYQLQTLVAGEEYIITGTLVSETGNAALYIRDLDSASYNLSTDLSVGEFTYTFTPTTSGANRMRIQLACTTTGIAVFDNISVTLKDSIKQATEDTADMYDVDMAVTGDIDLVTGDIYKYNGGATAGAVGGFYERVGGTTVVDVSLLDMTLTTAWTYLGTATTMSLQNPYFQRLDKVTRQDVILLTKTGYKTVKGIHYFGETYSNNDVATAYGWSKLGNNLYHDGVEEVIIVGVRGTLNAGAYHPVYNEFGCRLHGRDGAQTASDFWYTATALNTTSTYKAMVNYTTGGDIEITGRPDLRYYDKVYLASQGGIAPSALPYAGKLEDIMFDKAVQSDIAGGSGLQEGVEIAFYGDFVSNLSSSQSTALDGTPRSRIQSNIDAFGIGTNKILYANIDFSRCYIEADSGRYYSAYAIQTDNTPNTTIWLYRDDVHNGGTNDDYSVDTYNIIRMDKQPALLTRKSATHTDIIGDPANYPSDWLSHLASGKSIGFANALLVDDSGNEIDVDLNTLSWKLSKKSKLVSSVTRQKDDNSWENVSATLNSINNKTVESLGLYAARKPMLIPYTAANQTAPQTDPQKVVKAYPQTIASNSHSIYKGGLLTNACTGKVSVGNGTNGLESRVLENVIVGTYDYMIQIGDVPTVNVGDIILIDKEFDNVTEYTIGVANVSFSGIELAATNSLTWLDLQGNLPLPTHNTINLDNSDSPASKSIPALVEFDNGEYGVSYMQEEMVWDYTADAGTEATSIAGTVAQNANPVGTFIKITSGGYAGYYIVSSLQSASSWDTLYTAGGYIRNGNAYTSTGVLMATAWDGNGFGDNDKFGQLTNGTLTDINGNTVQTKVVSKRLGVFK